jgi:hypothetical protein
MILTAILELDKHSRVTPKRILEEGILYTKVNLEDFRERLARIKAINPEKLIVEDLSNKISFEALCQVKYYFKDSEDKLNKSDKIFDIDIIGNLIALISSLVLVYFLGIDAKFLKTELFRSTIEWSSVISLLLTIILFLWFNMRPSPTRLIYKKCLSVLEQTSDKIIILLILLTKSFKTKLYFI